jgi:LysM repeat protein
VSKLRVIKFVSVPVLASFVVLGAAATSFADSYTVQSGNTLSGIAAQYGDSWQQFQAVDHLANPNLIYPGEIIQIPGKGSNTFTLRVSTAPAVPAPSPVTHTEHNSYSPPSPVSSVNWDAVAACESSGDWSINTGNGFYGGLQFTKSTWDAYGGEQYAQYPNEASESAQKTVANAVLAGQGIGAWPVCGPRGE